MMGCVVIASRQFSTPREISPLDRWEDNPESSGRVHTFTKTLQLSSGQDGRDDLSVNIRQAKIAPGVAIGQFLVIQPH